MHDTSRLFAFTTNFNERQSHLARAGFAIFLLIGGVQALYGPVLPSVRASFGLSAATAGWVVGAHYLGSVIGVLLSLFLQIRLQSRSRLAVGLALVGAGAMAFALMHAWPWALVGIVSIGLGYGVLVVAVNALVAAGFDHQSAPFLILVNACFGGGAVMGPLLYGLFSSGNFRPAFLLAGGLAVLIIPLARGITEAPAESPRAQPTGNQAFPFALIGFVALFLLYTALESDTSGWMATHLVFHGYTQAAAAGFTATFWAALTIGRLVSVPISLRFSPLQMIAGALTGATVVTLAAGVHAITPFAYILTGFLLAPVFPVAFAWMDQSVPEVGGRASIALLGSLAGGLVFPVVVGRAIGANTPDVLPFGLAFIAALCLLVSLGLPKLIRQSQTNC